MKLDLLLSLVLNKNNCHLEITDKHSGETIVKCPLSSDDVVDMLSNRAYVHLIGEMGEVSRFGKVMQVSSLEFEIPTVSRSLDHSEKIKLARECADFACPEGWEHDGYFGAQNSFSMRDGIEYGRVTIRRWVDRDEQ